MHSQPEGGQGSRPQTLNKWNAYESQKLKKKPNLLALCHQFTCDVSFFSTSRLAPPNTNSWLRHCSQILQRTVVRWVTRESFFLIQHCGGVLLWCKVRSPSQFFKLLVTVFSRNAETPVSHVDVFNHLDTAIHVFFHLHICFFFCYFYNHITARRSGLNIHQKT